MTEATYAGNAPQATNRSIRSAKPALEMMLIAVAARPLRPIAYIASTTPPTIVPDARQATS